MSMLTRAWGQLWLSQGYGTEVATITSTRTLSSTNAHHQYLTASGGNVNVVLPSVAGDRERGQWYHLRNAGASNSLVVKKSDGSTTLLTLAPGEWAIVWGGGSSADWRVFASLTDILSAARTITAQWTFSAGALLKASVSAFYDASDATKKLIFDVSGITTATTRTKTVRDTNATLAEVGDSTSAAGTGASGGTAPAFTGTAPTAAETNAFTGTGFSTVGQVVTTSDNQTMALNECAGMWLITATQPPCLIVSNTAVSGAPAVLTVIGMAPSTAAEAYRILKAPTPAGSVASHTHTGPSHSHTII